MNKTKKRILEQSLKLFNADGLSEVSLRDIADSIDISIGNLQYHFKKRDEIIEGLYFELVQKIDDHFSAQFDPHNQLCSFLEISLATSSYFFEYRFFLLDFVQIIRNHDAIRQHYKELTIVREQQFFHLINSLVADGFMRAACIKDEYQNLYKRLEILTNFWLSSAIIKNSRLTKTLIEENTTIINQCIFPYLTQKGRLAYENLE